MTDVLIIGSEGAVGSLLCEKLKSQAPHLEVITYNKKEIEKDIHSLGLTPTCVVVNCASHMTDAQYATLETINCKVLDLTPHYRTHKDWLYGLPELKNYTSNIRSCQKVSNPGCFSQAGVLLLKPLVDSGLIFNDEKTLIQLMAIGGYSSGGKKAYSEVQNKSFNSCVHGLQKKHPHCNEIAVNSGFIGTVAMTPVSGEFERGTYVSLILPLSEEEQITQLYRKYYEGTLLHVQEPPSKIALSSYAGKEGATLYIKEYENYFEASIHFDNLLKGAASTALQNILSLVQK